MQSAQGFRQQLQLYQANVPLIQVPNASHDATAWRGALRPMFSWMTPQLAHQADLADKALAASERAKAKSKAKEQANPGRHHDVGRATEVTRRGHQRG